MSSNFEVLSESKFCGRLVCQDKFRFGCQGTCYRHALLLPPESCPGRLSSFLQAHCLQELLGTGQSLFLRAILKKHDEAHILGSTEYGNKVICLENEPDVVQSKINKLII